MRTTILIADDHAMFRQGLRHLLSREPDLEVIAEASDGQEALDHLRREHCDLLLTDAVMPVLNGIDLIRKVGAEMSRVRCLVVSGYAQSHYVGEALEAGAAGYVTKSADLAHLIEAVHAVAQGRTYLSPSVADVVVQRYVRQGHNGNGHANGHAEGKNGRGNGNASRYGVRLGSRTLTPREREVLQMLSEGHASKQIASRLCVSVKTVDTHRAAVMKKLELPSIAHLTKYAVREGITTLDY